MELKKYQQSAVETLKNYLFEVEKFGPKHAFVFVKETPYKSEFFGENPFICIKIPTGGGKTLVGCHAVNEIMSSVLRNKMDRGIVMWFVPSEAIKTQTLKKFKDRNDWHRRVLDENFQNSVRIFSNEEALRIRKEDVKDNLCIIISSLEAFRKEKTIQNKYKVYKENGELISHFENLNDEDFLEKDENDSTINSLANVIRLSNPLIVIDEGHKTKTQLSIDFLRELNPSFVIEFTATPRTESNILVEIHSSELKSEDMVKLPIVLESSAQWQNSILRGVAQREVLEKEAKKNKAEYIRPIVLLQAEQEKEATNKITVGKIKEFLIKERSIPEDEIAIKTSSKNELEGINLFSQKCKIRYIITVNALAEGWDCSFAYVLVSVANVGSKIAVEQIIGRIVRMPYARRKENEALNRSYIFASAKNFKEAANQIISGLESNGYSRLDLVDASAKEQKYELEVERKFKKDISVPVVTYNKEKLSFEDLIGSDFRLSKQNPEFEFHIHYDNDGRALIDIKDQDTWVKKQQQYLNLVYKDKDYSKEELIQWLDKKLRFTILEKRDKVAFLEKSINYQLKNKSLAELSVNRFVLQMRLFEVITELMDKYSYSKFNNLLDKKLITAKEIDKYPQIITLAQDIPQEFNKNYYGSIDKLNKEELNFAERLDSQALENIEFWIRNREKKDPFYIQGWKRGKFYPDFVAKTKNGNILAIEWKGEDRASNEDTKYKEEIGKIWEELDKKLHFFLVTNRNSEEVLKEISKL